MSDKKRKSNGRELRINPDATDEFKDYAFPTRVKGFEVILEYIIDGEIIGYVCSDMFDGVAIQHVYIPKENRTRDNILAMKEMFFDLEHPWLRERGVKLIVTACAVADTKTTGLLETLGFALEETVLGVMPVQEE